MGEVVVRDVGDEPLREVGELDLDRVDEEVEVSILGERKTCSSGIRDRDINGYFSSEVTRKNLYISVQL
jgi:hypothetical protein